jgi:hypothetical protein
MIKIPKLLKLSGLLLAGTLAAHAQLYVATGASTGVMTNFTFTLNTTANTLSVLVSNTQPGPGGVTGTLTSFGFNIPDNLFASASLTAAPTGWTLASPYDLNAGGNNFMQDIGAKTGNNVNGGSPQTGIAFGQTGTFVFQFADFANAAGFLGANGVSGRWQVVNAGSGSDAGFGNPGLPSGADIIPVPEPSTYGMIGAVGLLAGAILRRRLAKNRPAA